MRAPGRARSGPFLVPARFIFLTSGFLTIALAVFNTLHEFHATQVDRVYLGASLLVAIIWMAAVVTGFLGWRLGILVAALIALVQFGLLLSTHFVTGPGAIDTYIKQEGLPVGTVDITLIVACSLVWMSAGVSWTTPRGRQHSAEMLPVLIAALVGAVLVILQATDALHRSDIGAANAEDSALAAAVFASFWLAGGLWISRVRKTGALLIAIGTFGVWYSFVTLHLVKGGTSVQQIASASGAVWAWITAGAAVLAAASFLLSLGILVESLVRQRAKPAAEKQPVRRRA